MEKDVGNNFWNFLGKAVIFGGEIALHKGQKLSSNSFFLENSKSKHLLNLQISLDHTMHHLKCAGYTHKIQGRY